MAGKKKKQQPPKPPAPPQATKAQAVAAPPAPHPEPAPVAVAAPASAPTQPQPPAPKPQPVAKHAPAPPPAPVAHHHGHDKPIAKAKPRPVTTAPTILDKLPFELPDADGLPVINMPRLERKIPWLMPTLMSLAIISLFPLTNIYYNRAATHSLPRWSIIPDMDNQPKWKAQQANLLFADHRASRAWPEGTVRADAAVPDPWYSTGIVNGQWATGLPPQIEINQALLDRGQQRYNIYCSMCHGEAGYGDGTVAKRADLLKEGTWTVPLTYHGDQVRNRPVGHIFNSVTNGIRTMPAYGSQIPAHDRWAIVAWIRVLQASQHTPIDQVPAEQQGQLRARKPKVSAPAPPPAETAAPPIVVSQGSASEGTSAPLDPAAPAPEGHATPPPATQEGGH